MEGKVDKVSTDDLMSLCLAAEDQRNQIIEFCFGGIDDPIETHLEERHWYHDDLYSGVHDWLGIQRRSAVTIDYKFGKIRVPHAKENDQLKWLAVLTDYTYDIDEVTVCIVQPSCGPFTMHTYNREQLDEARQEVESILALIESPDAEYNAGESQCRYCSARGLCPALASKAEAVLNIAKADLLSPTQLSLVMDKLTLIESMCKAVRQRAVEMLEENPDAIPNYKLVSGSSRRTVADTVKAHEAIVKSGIATDEEFLAVTTAPVGKLQKLVQKAEGCSPAEAKEMLTDLLGSNLVSKEGAVKPCRVE